MLARLARAASLTALFAASGVPFACSSAPMAPTALTILQLSPAAGPVGAEVTVTGTGFARSGNVVKFGVGYIGGLASPDGKSLRFTVPEYLNTCPPAELGSIAPCADMYPPVRPGDYPVSVVTRKGASRELTFRVVER